MDSTLVALLRDAGTEVHNLSVAAIEAIKTASPVVWEMVRVRIMAESILMMVIPPTAALVALLVAWLGRDVKDSTGFRYILVISLVFAAFAVVIACLVSIDGLLNLLSLDYATAERILKFVR
jgi:ABC-type molybdate transport system permease subunit